MSQVIDYFRKYIHIPSASDESTGARPSTPGQKQMAQTLEEDMRALGLKDVRNFDNGYVWGRVPANAEGQPVIGLIAHLDVVNNEPCDPMRERVVENYGGDAIEIGSGVTLSPEEFPAMKRWKGKDLIVTDGSTILGADDKAGVAEIMALCARLMADPGIPHGEVAVAFTPDEEIGSGAEELDLEAFKADFAYTVDGGELGEVEYENFNAASARLNFHGVSIHPGSAKNRMKNAALMAGEFISLLPAFETPAHTEGREGFYHLVRVDATPEQAFLAYIIRDHDALKLEEKKAYLARCRDMINARWGEGSCELEIRDSYRNMYEAIRPHMHVVERAAKAFEACGVTPVFPPVRGGTDGAQLSFRGLPCPNIGTGGFCCHGPYEHISAEDMDRAVDIIVNIAAGVVA